MHRDLFLLLSQQARLSASLAVIHWGKSGPPPPPPHSQPSIIMLRPCYVAHGYEKVNTDAELRLPVGWVVSLTVRSEGALEPDARRWEWGNSTTKIPWLLGLQVSMLWRNPLQGHAGPRIAQLVVCWARCPAWSSLVGSVLLRRILLVEGIFPLVLAQVLTPFP